MTTTKPDIWSLPALIAWLEQQPADGPYEYSDHSHCLLAKYLRACGWPRPALDSTWADDFSTGEIVRLPDGWNDLSYGKGVGGSDGCERTFGAALARAKALLP